MVEETDLTLIRRTQAGDAHAFGPLVQRYQASVFNVCYRMMGARQEAEDLTQEAFMRAYQRLHLYDDSRPFGPWLRTVAANLCLNKLQRPPPTFTPLEEGAAWMADVDEGNPEEMAVQSEAAHDIRIAIRGLPPQQRAVIELRHFQGLSYDEIASQLDLTLAAVKTNLFRARKQLAELLKTQHLP